MASDRATVINLVKTVLGAGMLALPFAFKCQGIALAIFSLFFGSVTTVTGMMILTYASGFLPAGSASFFEVAKITYPSLAVLFDVAIGLKCFGVCISYLVIIGNLMPTVTAYFGFETSQLIWLGIAMLIVTPISFQRSLESLKTASMIALSSVVYLVIIVIVHFIRNDTADQRGDISVFKPDSAASVISSVPIIVFAFTCTQNMFSAVNEMDNKSLKSVFRVSVTSISISLGTYLIVGLVGYLSFGNNVSDNLISMYSQSLSSTLGRLAIVILVMFSYPLMCHPARASITNVLKAYKQWRSRGDSTEGAPLLGSAPTEEAASSEAATHSVITALILILSFILANTLNSLELILSFVGATGATAVSFILPGIFGYSLSSSDRENSLVNLTSQQKRVVNVVSILLFGWGVIVAVLALGVNISRLIRG